MFKIFIDPGHGGSDPGAVANGLKEKDLTLTIALKIKHMLDNQFTGHIATLSRYRDDTLTLKERTDMANGWRADYLMSIHINAGGGTGFESFTYHKQYPNKSKTNSVRKVIHDEIVNETGFRNRGKREANFHMLRESAMSAVLTENGFLDHDIDAKNLKDDSFLNKIARGHAVGLAKAIGLERRTVVTDDRFYMIRQGDTLWRIAQMKQLNVADLLRLNPSIDEKELQVGQRIRLR